MYQLFIRIYDILIGLAAVFNKKARLLKTGQRESVNYLNAANWQHKNTVWVHCASLGEFEQGRPIIEALKKQHPTFAILLTFYSPSGFEIRKNYNQADLVLYLPLDSQKNAKQFIEKFNPKLAIFIKYEIWPNYMQELTNKGVTSILVSAIFREDQYFFKSKNSKLTQALKQFSWIFVQNDKSKKLLQSINYHNFTKVGDTRFDRVLELSKSVPPINRIEKFKGHNQLMVIGSAWPQDFSFLKSYINKAPANLKFLLVPHDIHPAQIKKWQSEISIKNNLYSTVNEQDIAQYKVIIIDSVGLLSACYQYANYVWIGGAFGKGLHNILEAAVFGVPLFFGHKNYKKFQEAVDLQKIEAAFTPKTPELFEQKIDELIKNKELIYSIKNKQKQYIDSNIGATSKIMLYIEEKLR